MVGRGVFCDFAGVFEGCFGKSVFFWVVFSWLICGDSLVDCGGLTRTFRLRRIFHFFQLYFSAGSFSGWALHECFRTFLPDQLRQRDLLDTVPVVYAVIGSYLLA